MLTNSDTGKTVFAIIGDGGNAGEVGEISYYAAQQLGFNDITYNSASSVRLQKTLH